MPNKAEAVVANKQPIEVHLEAGKSYWWCSCGKSAKQPFCDGSHQGGPFTPVEYKPEKSASAWFCACKQTGHPPLCDGKHKQL